LTSGKKYVVEA